MAELIMTELEGLGQSPDKMTPLSMLKLMALVRPGFTFDDSEDFATLASWQAAIVAKNVMIVDEIVVQENITVEDGKFTTPYGNIIPIWKGMRGLKVKAKLTLDQHKTVQTYSNLGWDLIRGDKSGNLVGVLNSDGTVGGFSLDTFFVDSQTEPTEAEPALTPITFQEGDPDEYNASGIIVKPSWRLSKLQPLTTLVITGTTVAANAFTMTAAFKPPSKFNSDGTDYSVPVSGLLAADLQLLNANGTVNVIASVVESTSTPGTYVVTGTTFTAGSVRIKANVDSLYESAFITLTAAA